MLKFLFSVILFYVCFEILCKDTLFLRQKKKNEEKCFLAWIFLFFNVFLSAFVPVVLIHCLCSGCFFAFSGCFLYPLLQIQ